MTADPRQVELEDYIEQHRAALLDGDYPRPTPAQRWRALERILIRKLNEGSPAVNYAAEARVIAGALKRRPSVDHVTLRLALVSIYGDEVEAVYLLVLDEIGGKS